MSVLVTKVHRLPPMMYQPLTPTYYFFPEFLLPTSYRVLRAHLDDVVPDLLELLVVEVLLLA